MEIYHFIHVLCASLNFKLYGYTSMFACHFTKGNNFYDFLFASLDNKPFPNKCLFLKELASRVAKSFL